MSLPIKSLLACALLAAAAAPVHAQDTTAKAVTKDAPKKKHDRNVITAEELAAPERKAQTVLEVIRALRPNFLNVRGTQSCLADRSACSAEDMESGKVHASIDGNTVVSLSEVANMHVSNVVEIRYLDAGAAMQKFGGSAHQGPVIVIKTM